MADTSNDTRGHDHEGACNCGRSGWGGKRTGFMMLSVAGTLVLLALFFTYVKEYKYIGPGGNDQSTIQVAGDGEVYHAPDVAELSFSIINDAKSAADARKVVDEKMKAIHDALTGAGIAEKDIKTTGYNLNPKYEYQKLATPCTASANGSALIYCPPEGKQTLIGYTITQSVDVKVRDIDKTADVLTILTDKGASDVNGPTFTIDNPDTLKAQARAAAITKAKAKADQLAKDLGVSLVRIISFSENGNNPIIYNYARTEKALASDAGGAPTPNITPGENKITSNVTIVYEIR